MTISLQLSAKSIATDAINRAMASSQVMDLARMLQRIGASEPQKLIGEFRPAPIYLQMATVLTSDADVAAAFIKALS